MVKLYEGASVTKHIAEYTDAYIVNAETGSYKDIEEASVTKHSAEHTNADNLEYVTVRDRHREEEALVRPLRQQRSGRSIVYLSAHKNLPFPATTPLTR